MRVHRTLVLSSLALLAPAPALAGPCTDRIAAIEERAASHTGASASAAATSGTGVGAEATVNADASTPGAEPTPGAEASTSTANPTTSSASVSGDLTGVPRPKPSVAESGSVATEQGAVPDAAAGSDASPSGDVRTAVEQGGADAPAAGATPMTGADVATALEEARAADAANDAAACDTALQKATRLLDGNGG